jgi:ribosomal protein S18 acetylase RimI-like enzyme
MDTRTIKTAIRNGINAMIRLVRSLNQPSKAASLRSLLKRGESLSGFVIREATIQDVPRLAALHVQTFNETYFPAQSPTYYVREYQWRQQFEQPNDNWFVLVVENEKGDLVGFAKGIRYAHTDLPEFNGELNKIYLLRQYQRLGLGKRLLAQVARRFQDMGITNTVLFGVPQNPTCYFYEAMGAQRIYGKNGAFHGAYGFTDLARLAAQEKQAMTVR